MKINKFVIGGLLILGAVVFLIWSSTAATSEYFLTIDELNAKGSEIVNRNLRVSGAVIGDTIQYDAQTLTLTFEVAHVPGDQAVLEDEGGLAEALHQSPPGFGSETGTDVATPTPDDQPAEMTDEDTFDD